MLRTSESALITNHRLEEIETDSDASIFNEELI